MNPTRSLPRVRRKVARLLTDECTITRSAGRPVYDKSSSTTMTAPGTTIYKGACRVVGAGGQRSADMAGEPFVQQGYLADLPVDAPEIKPEDRLVLTSTSDPALAGRSLRVADIVKGGSYAVTRRLSLTDDEG